MNSEAAARAARPRPERPVRGSSGPVSEANKSGRWSEANKSGRLDEANKSGRWSEASAGL